MNTFNFLPEGWKSGNLTVNDDIFEGIVEKCDENYNLYVKLDNGISGIIPREEVEEINLGNDGLPKVNLCAGKVNRYVQFKQKGKNGDNLLFSRRDVQKEVLDFVKNNLQVGQIVNGIVKNITPYGAFIDIGGGVVGLVHIEDLSIARIKSPFERIKIGQKLNIMVKSIDRETGRINLSYKEILGNWEENVQNFSVGMKTKGIVRETEKNKNGIFIELTPNLIGMAEYKEGLNYGEKIDIFIKKIDYNRKKIKLVVV